MSEINDNANVTTNTKTMSLDAALKKIAEVLRMNAEHQAKDKGATVYTVEMHAQAAGLAMRMVFFPKDPNAPRLEATSANFAAVFHATYNHSAWRIKWESDAFKYFAKKAKRDFSGAMAELEEEFGE